MKTIINFILLLFCLNVFSQQKSIASFEKVDFSSVDAFWDVVDSLKNDKTLSQDHWGRLFNTPFYNFYKDWGQQSYIQQVFSNAYMPSKKQIRDSIFALDNWNALLLKHLISVDTLRDQLQAFRAELENRRLLDEALKKAKPYLPKGTMKRYDDKPKIAFGIYQPDGNAGQIIVVDLKLAMEIDILGFIAHEAHHYYSVKIRRKLKGDKKDSTHIVINSIFQLQLEGLADLIDKEDYLKSNGKGFPSQLFETYQKHYKNPFLVLNKIDSLLVLSSEYPDDANKNYKLIKELLPLGGHPHGYYMAQIILKKAGKKALLKTIENPFEFIRTYNRAATKIQGEFVFSKKALEYLKKIEGSYLLN